MCALYCCTHVMSELLCTRQSATEQRQVANVSQRELNGDSFVADKTKLTTTIMSAFEDEFEIPPASEVDPAAEFLAKEQVGSDLSL